MKRSLWSRLRPRRGRELAVEFALDLAPDGRHAVSLVASRNGSRTKLKNIAALSTYGATVTLDGNEYTLPLRVVEILQSLHRLDPEITRDGALLFDVFPPALEYLRTRKDVTESDRSAALEVSDDPLEPVAHVDFDPKTGLHVQTGYGRKGARRPIPASDLAITRDGRHARARNTFFPLQKPKSSEAERMLQAGDRHVELDGIPEFFKRDLVLLRTHVSAVLSEKAQKIKVVKTPFFPRVNVNRPDPEWLDVSVDYKAGRRIYSAKQIDDALAAGKDHLHTDDFTWTEIDHRALGLTKREMKKIGAVRSKNGFRVPIARFASVEEFIDTIGGERVLSAEYAGFLEQLSGFEPDTRFKLTQHAERALKQAGISLRPYQRAGIHWVTWLTQNHLHGVLADDMGLGKTIQTLSAVAHAHYTLKPTRPTLIVSPKSVVPFWVREIHRCAPGIRVHAYVGPKRDRAVWKQAGTDWFVTTYEILARDMEAISATPFFFLVLDEATMIKNPNAQRTKAIKSINAVHRLALSGTPVENRLRELWSIFDFVIRGLFGTQSSFAENYEAPIAAGDQDRAEDLSRRIRPFLLRRLKEEVAKDLPEKIELEDWCDLTKEQRRLYEQIQERDADPLRDEIARGRKANAAFNVLPILTKLKQVCDHPALITGKVRPIRGRSEKFDAALDRIVKIQRGGEQVVVFSHFLKTLDLFEEAFAKEGITSVRIDGGTQNRQALIDRFNARGATVALCSIQATGYGITLTSANHVIHFDRWWNPATEDQATDRVYRIGQKKTVYVYRTLVSGTLEERIAELLASKRGLADQVIGAALDQPMHWSREELLELLRPFDP